MENPTLIIVNPNEAEAAEASESSDAIAMQTGANQAEIAHTQEQVTEIQEQQQSNEQMLSAILANQEQFSARLTALETNVAELVIEEIEEAIEEAEAESQEATTDGEAEAVIVEPIQEAAPEKPRKSNFLTRAIFGHLAK